MNRRKINLILILVTAVLLIVILSLASIPRTKSTIKPTVVPPKSDKITPEQKAMVVKIITDNTDHFKKLWQDGLSALGTTQYTDSYEGLAALNDPTTNAAKFSAYKQHESPVNDTSMNDALTKANESYTGNLFDDNLNKWRMDMMQLSSDMGKWVDDATDWQIKSIATVQLKKDEQTVDQDFVMVDTDIQDIKNQ